MSLDKISKLLKMAENAATEHEADAFMRRAEELAATYSVDLAVARAHIAEKERRQVPEVREIKVGAKGQLRNLGLINLWVNIAQAYNIRTDASSDRTLLFAYGFSTDLDLAEALWSSLAVQMVAAGDRFIRNREFAGETRWDQKSWTHKPVTARGARQAFHEAFGDRIGTRIRLAVIAEKDRQTSADPASTGTELALRTAELEVKDFYTSTSKARGRYRGTTAQSERGADAGRRAGDTARIGTGRAITAGRTAVSA